MEIINNNNNLGNTNLSVNNNIDIIDKEFTKEIKNDRSNSLILNVESSRKFVKTKNKSFYLFQKNSQNNSAQKLIIKDNLNNSYSKAFFGNINPIIGDCNNIIINVHLNRNIVKKKKQRFTGIYRIKNCVLSEGDIHVMNDNFNDSLSSNRSGNKKFIFNKKNQSQKSSSVDINSNDLTEKLNMLKEGNHATKNKYKTIKSVTKLKSYRNTGKNNINNNNKINENLNKKIQEIQNKIKKAQEIIINSKINSNSAKNVKLENKVPSNNIYSSKLTNVNNFNCNSNISTINLTPSKPKINIGLTSMLKSNTKNTNKKNRITPKEDENLNSKAMSFKNKNIKDGIKLYLNKINKKNERKRFNEINICINTNPLNNKNAFIKNKIQKSQNKKNTLNTSINKKYDTHKKNNMIITKKEPKLYSQTKTNDNFQLKNPIFLNSKTNTDSIIPDNKNNPNENAISISINNYSNKYQIFKTPGKNSGKSSLQKILFHKENFSNDNNFLNKQKIKSSNSQRLLREPEKNIQDNLSEEITHEPIEIIKDKNQPITERKNKQIEVINKKIIKNASICKKGKNLPGEPEKINQDNLFKVNYEDINLYYYGVCDGHGSNGHLVSKFVKNNLPYILYENIISKISDQSDINSFIKESFHDSFLLVENKLKLCPKIDSNFSGTTCVSILFCQNQIISSNVGDSRAIKGQLINSKWEFEALSRDHKAENEEEELRIIKKYNGKIHPYKNKKGEFIGPKRIWLPNHEGCGIMVSRSIGDQIAATVGVVCEPEVLFFPHKVEDKFIILASDGLWEYISNQQAVDIVAKYYEKLDCDGAISELYGTAKNKWEENEEFMDDITIILLFIE